ncbi:uncharacterized protein LOC106073048 isoform X1 [Biomphalaria glabrata]|uniref:Uncharacterized protein LOC106073048 isoform X1 n=1 Tax=Biomphalaria glabrata TaxID=6526 RepID=A0A9W2YEM7_BIOGL|nr:uncharacterized protein LOC106073048 isoform X1 [Biomphalaria glabrata]
MNNTHVHMMPHWTRVNVLDKVYFPKQYSTRDAKLNMEMNGNENYNTEELSTGSEVNTLQRIHYLERNIAFLQHEHAEVLKSLQDEVDMLKRENKELQFKIVMSQTPKEDVDVSLPESVPLEHGMCCLNPQGKKEEIKILFLEEEIKELKHALRETRNKNHYLTQRLEQEEKQKEKQKGNLDNFESTLPATYPNSLDTHSKPVPAAPVEPDGQPMSLSQCHALIKHLQQANEKQAHELNQLKLDLRDVLYSHKWTPDAFLMAKAYIAEDDRKEEGSGYLPRIPMKNPTRKIPDIAYVKENVSLPALHLTVGNKAVERKKKTQIIQKSKLRPSALP